MHQKGRLYFGIVSVWTSGYYEFGEIIFINPLSSFFPFKGGMPYYEISQNSLKIINNREGSVQEFTGDLKKILG